MVFDLHIQRQQWRDHLDSAFSARSQMVPVIKGNGYGLGRDRLAAEASRLGADTIAIGTHTEVADALAHFPGDIQILTPWRPFTPVVDDRRIVHTISRVEDIATLTARQPGARVLIELETSMARHGIDRHELAAAADALTGLKLEGVAIHLPMQGTNLAEARLWAAVVATSRLPTTRLFVSHLSAGELDELRRERPELSIRSRVGTDLWLGDLSAFDVQATVIDTHRVERGETVGYRQVPVPRTGTVVIVSGGTSHGIGLEAPRHAANLKERSKALAKGGLAAAGWSQSPFSINGKQRWFIEPPHMQASMVFLPADCQVPLVGARVRAAVRYTTATFDHIIDED